VNMTQKNNNKNITKLSENTFHFTKFKNDKYKQNIGTINFT